jgi:hypothetical protein
MMTGALVFAALWTIRPSLAFVSTRSRVVRGTRSATATGAANAVLYSSRTYNSITSSTTRRRIGGWKRFLASESSSSSSSSSSPSPLAVQVEHCVSRLGTLQTLLSKHGAPGSQGCRTPDGDLVAVTPAQETPELLASMLGHVEDDGRDYSLANLHPYLFPIARSRSTGNFICAYRNPWTEESDPGQHRPWPIVEAKLGGPGVQLLSLNSEHLMRRIVCEVDFTGSGDPDHLVQLYNERLGRGLLPDPTLDTPYQPGAVAQLGYGVDKYVLLRVGPFPDLYQNMARQHFAKGDEQSALISAETANGKMPGFASTFRFYARLLSSFPHREEETRDAARMCLRLPLWTIGMDASDFEEVAVLGQMCEASDPPATAMAKLKEMYDLMKQVEEEDRHASGKTSEQQTMDEATDLMNDAVLSGKEWRSIRPKLVDLYKSIGREDMASFVDI